MLILQQLAGHAEGRTLGELCRLLGIPKSTAFGILSTLQAGEFIRRDARNERYRLSYKMLEIGGAYAQSLDLVQEFLSVARGVVAALNESAHLAILDGRDVLHISELNSSQPLRLQSYIGTRLPASCTALGKVLLGLLDDAELEARFGGQPLVRMTDRSVRTFVELRDEAQRVRLIGYARDLGETTIGLQCVAAPIYGRGGGALAAMSVSWLSHEADDPRLAQIIMSVREGALQVSRALGYRGGTYAGAGGREDAPRAATAL
jgi:DNA-binding IclR family transcriptional regulator